MFKSNVKFYITTVEPNSYDYISNNINAGNAIYQAINSNNLMKMVKKFSSYNKRYINEPFVSFENPDVEPNYACFRGKGFRIDKTWEFINYLEDIIKESSTSDVNLLKLAHELTITLYYLTQDRPPTIKNQILNMFSDLFSDYSTYKEIRKLFINEIDNHNKGKSTTFQAYKNNRERIFERAQLALYSDVKTSICHRQNINFISFIVNSNDNVEYIIKSNDKMVCENITLSDKTYSNCAVKITSKENTYHIHILPMNITLDRDFYDQCIRQWIRANYGKKYNLNPASDFIQYYVLGDVLRVLLSDVSSEVKDAYKSIAKVMLDRKRFATEITEYDYLMTNHPAPVTNVTEDKINWIFNRTMIHCKMYNIVTVEKEDNTTYNKKVPLFEPMTFWYAFVKSMDDYVFSKAQLPFCIEDMTKNGVTDENILSVFKSNIKLVQEHTHSDNSIVYDYQCYITWENTSETCGYTIPPHQINSKYICSSRFVLSEEGYEVLSKETCVKCPICYKPLDIASFVKIDSMESELVKEKKGDFVTLNEKYYNVNSFEKVEITSDMFMKETEDDFKLKQMSDCLFDTIAYTIQVPYIQEAIGSRSIEIKTQEEFNNVITHRYPFLNRLDWNGVCLAGGFCRSILLRQRLKDFDFFLYGENHKENFNRFLKQILQVFKEQDEKLKLLIMYKHQFNVFEVVCVHDPNNFFGEEYKLDNFKQYDFKSLHLFDRYTVIDPKTGIVYRQRNKFTRRRVEIDPAIAETCIESKDFSNYFEDGDISGVRMKYRLQFVLTANKNIESIFSNFDMYPCRVAWDGEKTWFTNKSEHAYKYMINIVNENNYSTLFDHRLSKYLWILNCPSRIEY